MFKNWSKKDTFKFKDLKPYGSLESLYKGSRKYRRVFDEIDCNYLNVELSFYNILFDEEDWDTEIRLRALEHPSGKEICSIKKHIRVTKNQNIVYVREGWGTPEAGFWQKGTYKWQAYIGDERVGETFVYVMNIGQVSAKHNPYFKVKTIKLFESPYEGTLHGDRTYLQAFDHANTRYINVEVTLENLITQEKLFPLELQFNIYNDTRHLKANMTYFKPITNGQKEIMLDTGYGTKKAGFWYRDKYTLEMIYMDQLIAIIPFEVGDEMITYNGSYNYNTFNIPVQQIVASNKKITFKEARTKLYQLVGLESVKKQIDELATYLRFKQLRIKKGFAEPENFNLHSVFMGPPGTGKTTVAYELGMIYKSLGLLSDGKIHEVGRADLVGEFIGQTAPKVKKIIEQARGGILFIDEAYALTNRGNDEKDYGREVIEVLLKEMSDGKGDIAIICAGYIKEMEQFLASNMGMHSRFGQIIRFPDYTPNELMAIASFMSKSKDVTIQAAAADSIYKHIVEAYRTRNRMFGNARYVNSILEEAKKNMALRLMLSEEPEKLTKEQLSTICLEDVEKVFAKMGKKSVQLPVNESLLQEALHEFNALVGLENIKNDVHELVKLARYYLDIGRNLQETFSMHTVFIGSPGTGKTTVARILVKIYKALGILERGHLVECDRKSLVAGFVGQTAIKTSTIIDSAIGGGLFIDEAYALAQGGNDFGREAIETLLKRMEDERGKFVLIVAGYTKEMETFMDANPGLKSRFDKQFRFHDYSNEQLMTIAENMYEQQQLKMDVAAKAFLANHIANLLNNRHKYFGNARTIRKIVEETTRKQHLRLAELSISERTKDMINTITQADMKHLKTPDRSGIGFQIGW